MSNEDARIVCPNCRRRFYLKPPYNTADECMTCKQHRLHPEWGPDRGASVAPVPASLSGGTDE